MLICVDAFYLRKRFACGVDIYDDSNMYLIHVTFENDEDRGSAFCVVCSRCNAMADNASLFVEYFG